MKLKKKRGNLEKNPNSIGNMFANQGHSEVIDVASTSLLYSNQISFDSTDLMAKKIKTERLAQKENIPPNYSGIFSVKVHDVSSDDDGANSNDFLNHLTNDENQQPQSPINEPPTFEPDLLSCDDFDSIDEPPTNRINDNNKCGIVDKFFSIIETNGDNLNTSCKLCQTRKEVRGSKKATSNFIRHMNIYHKQEYAEHIQSEENRKKTGGRVTPLPLSQQLFEKVLTQLIVYAMLPISFVTSRAFQIYLHSKSI